MRLRRVPGLLAVTVGAALACGSCGSTASPVSPTPVGGQTPSAQPSPAASETARYRLTFDAVWSSATHPEDFPSTAHFSSLVGGTHSGAVAFWREGGPATEGIRNMAERGGTALLSQEIVAAVQAGTAERSVVGGGLGASPGSVSVEFEVSQRFPLATFVSMVAPSPDWFVGVSGLSLFDNGAWVDERRIDLLPWDAGTDSGSTFTSPDRETVPRAPISLIRTAPLSPGAVARPLGRFTFTRLAS